MLSVIAKAVSSYLLGQTPYEFHYFNEDDDESSSKKGAKDEGTPNDNSGIASVTDPEEDQEEILDIHGTITTIIWEKGYGLINDNIFFDVNVITGKQVCVGDKVSVTAYRKRKEDGWRAREVHVASEIWDGEDEEDSAMPSQENSTCRTNCSYNTNSKSDPEAENASHLRPQVKRNFEGSDVEKTLMGMITAIKDDSIEINNMHFLYMEAAELYFKPFIGDWISATYIEDDEIKIAKYIKPLREDNISGKITSLRMKTGVIDSKALFDIDVCQKGYQPKQWDTVVARIIESKQGKFHWRALNVIPKRLSNRLKSDFAGNSELHKEFMKDLLSDKQGISISSPLDFGKVCVRQMKYMTIWIRNDGKTDQLFVSCKLQTSASEESQFRLGTVHLYSWSGEEEFKSEGLIVIPAGASAYLNITCEARHLGNQRQLVLFEFKNFVIGRYVTIKVYDPAEDILAPVAPFHRSNRRQLVEKHYGSKNGAVIPGHKPSFAVNKMFSVRLPQYQIPDCLWELEKDKSADLALSLPVLLEELSLKNYVDRFTILLHLEEIQLHLAMREMDMIEVCLRHQGPLLALTVPGLSEGRPSLLVGDKVILSPPVDAQQGPRYEGFIHEVLQNEVLLKFHDGFHADYGGETYDVEFYFSRTQLRRCHYAVHLAPQIPENVLFPTKLCIKMPQVHFIEEGSAASFNKDNNEAADVKDQKPVPQGLVLKWLNRSLNERQKAAVMRILSGMCRPLPYVIFGPPGTGKTVTVVEAILQVFLHVPHSRILACTPSNSAADLITTRIHMSGLVKDTDMVRLNAFQRADEFIPDEVKPYCTNGSDLQVLSHHRIIVSTCKTAGLFYSLGLSSSHFTHVFIDEAGQATEPECLIPLCLSAMGEGQVILAGDPMQLGPVLQSVKAKTFGLNVSFLERIMKRRIYERDPDAFSEYGDYDPFLVTKLVINYRSHPAILELPSKLFYHGDLICNAPKELQEKFVEWSCLPKAGFPVLFHGIRGEDLQESNSPSWFNPAEVVQVIHYLQDLYERKVSPQDVGIVTPYKKQAEKIRLLMGSFGMEVCKVGSVEEFQGQERQVIILSTVRSSQDMVHFDIQHNMGFLSNPKRFNVGVTRAQSLLIVVGDPWLLRKDSNWEALIKYCVENGGYTGCSLDEDSKEIMDDLAIED